MVVKKLIKSKKTVGPKKTAVRKAASPKKAPAKKKNRIEIKIPKNRLLTAEGWQRRIRGCTT